MYYNNYINPGFNTQFQNQMYQNNMGIPDMSQEQIDNEIMKAVFEGMDETPSGDYKEDMKKIMNYVPVFDKSAISNFEGCTGTYITITFSSTEGTKKELTVPEDAKLKDVFLEFGKKSNISEENIKSHYFLINGGKINADDNRTLKDANIGDKNTFIVMKLIN